MRGEGYSLSDIAAATGSNNGFGGDTGAWWIIIIIVLFGWGRNGFGAFGNNSGGVGENYVLATDFATIERKLDTISNGICDSTFALNNTVNNGFFGVQNALCQGFNGLNVAYLQGTNALSSQLADCCCKNQRGLDAINYNNVINTNTIQQTLCTNTRDIIENQNANYRALHDEIVANRIEDKNAQIQAQQNEINALRLSASQSAQNEYLLNSLRNGCPVNAQLVCGNQPIPVRYIDAGCGCGYNNSCSC